jgi:ubiquinone/menaquinone biosynthesis C-methylase UbiE
VLDEKRKQELVRRFDSLAQERRRWMGKNKYYYEDQTRYFQFLVPPGSSVLELGCGTGDLLNALKPKRGVGVDFSSEMLRVAKETYPDLEFREADVEGLESWGETFDIIVLPDIVGHLQDIEETLSRLRAFCRPETRVIIAYYNFLWEPVLKLGEILGMKMPQQYQNWLATEDICNLLALTNFQVVKTECRLLMPKRIPWLSSVVNKYVASLPGIRKLCLCRYIVARPTDLREKRDYATTILIPCRNEKGNIDAAVQRIPEFGSEQEIIFVEGHSVDGTLDEIKRVRQAHPEKEIKWMVQEGQGKGDAVRKGFAAARGDILMILDADLTVPPEDLPKFYHALAEDQGEFINGCRLVYPVEKQAMRLLNLLGNKLFSLLFTWILNQPFKDTLCGTKALFKKDYGKIQAGRSYFGEFDPFGDFDLIFGAVKQNLKVVEIPVRYRERTYGVTNIQRFRHGWLLFKMTFFAYRKIKAI